MSGRTGARWEFRCWPSPARAVAVARLVEKATDWERMAGERRTDIYLLPPDRPTLLPKVRGGERLEVKRLLETRDRLERWDLPFAEPLPLTAEAHERAVDWLGRAFGDQPGGQAELARDGWIVVPVVKDRRRWRSETTSVEVTEADGRWTVAFEGSNPGRLLAHVQELGLADLKNRSYRSFLENREHGSGSTPPN